MQPIIKVENLGKSYLIGHQRERYIALRDVLANKTRQMVSKTKNILSGGQLIAGNEIEEFWALKDINFEVQQGDRVGIIGRNGAGKSTLLKVLSRITEPTTGRIRLKGRVASLLEVGTGFHPELSGRENIYLNGAILGMSQTEVRKKFDEIVDFAGVEKFLDTPVKRYSSGMYVRLAFAVAAHLEPEILIIDEVLAVGDAEFQKKCLGKMEDVSKNDGRTVIFVSHNMSAIKSLCNNGILLSNGRNAFSGNIEDTVAFYMSESYNNNPNLYFEDLTLAPGNENIRIKSFEISPIIGNELNVESGINFILQFYNYKSGINMDATFELSTVDEICVFHIGKVITPNQDSREGIYEVKFQLKPYTLNAGKYKMKLIFGESQRYLLWMKDNVLNFEVENTLTGQGTNMGIPPGVLRPQVDFTYNFID